MTANTPDEFDKAANTGFTHIVNATRFSAQGLKAALKYESAFRLEMGLTFFLLPIGYFITNTLREFVTLMALSLFVFAVEFLNSGIEAAIDRIGPEQHPLSGRAKDFGSAAVTCALIIAGMFWALTIFEFLSPYISTWHDGR